jgi:acetyltransferase-like isoleucine patch superfamily enzyme
MSPVARTGIDPSVRIHPTALIEEGVTIGPRSAVWDNVHIRHGASLGHDTNVGEKCYIAYDVRIGDYVKLNAMVYICALVTIEDAVMIAAGTTFTNDMFPRALDRELAALETAAVTEETLATVVERGATIGAQATIGPGIKLGRYCMVGMGAVVTKSVPPHALVVGSPARVIGYVCACGPRLAGAAEFEAARPEKRWTCERCGRVYARRDGILTLQHDPHAHGALLAP